MCGECYNHAFKPDRSVVDRHVKQQEISINVEDRHSPVPGTFLEQRFPYNYVFPPPGIRCSARSWALSFGRSALSFKMCIRPHYEVPEAFQVFREHSSKSYRV